jgi:hypothetical protein
MLFRLNAQHLWYELVALFRAPILRSVRSSSILEQHLGHRYGQEQFGDLTCDLIKREH